MKKKLIIGLASAGVVLTSAGLIGMASAATTNTGQQSLVDKIATKFHLNKTDVQAVFDQNHAEKQAERTVKEKTRLDVAVKAGTITQAQEDMLIAKQTEMHTFVESLKDKTPEERKLAMKTKMDEFKQWITDNKIPDNLVHMGGHGRANGMGMGGRMMDGDKPDLDAVIPAPVTN